MSLFEQSELRLIDALANGKSAKKISTDSNISEETLGERLDALKVKVGASTQAEIHDRFVALTGWTNPPKDYPA